MYLFCDAEKINSKCMSYLNKWSIGCSVLLVTVLIFAIAFKLFDIKESYSSGSVKETVENGDKVFLKIYADWCGYCKRLKPEWAKLEKSSVDGVKLMKIEEKEKGRYSQFMKEYPQVKVEGFPTLLFISERGVEAYDGRRTFESMYNFIRDGNK